MVRPAFLVNAPLPAILALMVPLSTSKDVAVRVPLPVIWPPLYKPTAPTVWLVVPRLRVAPVTVTLPLMSPSVPLPVKASVPTVTLVPLS